MNQRSLSMSELTSASMSMRNRRIRGANDGTFTHLHPVVFGRYGVKADHTLIPPHRTHRKLRTKCHCVLFRSQFIVFLLTSIRERCTPRRQHAVPTVPGVWVVERWPGSLMPQCRVARIEFEKFVLRTTATTAAVHGYTQTYECNVDIVKANYPHLILFKYDLLCF